MKLCIIVGTRPEIIRLASTISTARKYFDVSLIHTGQNYDYNLNQVFFDDLSLAPPEYYLDCNKESSGKAVGDIIAKSYEMFEKLKPDAILILGDTNSCLCAYSAKRLKIPIFHLEAGNRCFDPNVPEELNRRMIDHLSDINMCYMEHARRNLIQENLKPQYTFVVGSPMPEVLLGIKDKIEESNILEKLSLEKGKYFVWSSHREENINLDNNFDKMINSVNSLAEEYNMPVLFSAHPRTKNMIVKKGMIMSKNVIMSEPLGLIDYCQLQKNAACVISDSGTVTEESAILKFRGVLLRTSTEHPEGVDAGTIVLGNIDWKYLKDSIKLCMKMDVNQNEIVDYQHFNFSEKVCKIIAGYYSIVNKFIWMK